MAAAAAPQRIPRPPGYAWAWLQRSRPVLLAAADALTGAPPGPTFLEDLRARYEDDAFTRDVLAGVIVDVAFGGRIPTHRPAGASWDRGLTWWAAALAGTTPAAFDARPAPAGQPALFTDEPAAAPPLPARQATRIAELAPRAPEAAALAARLRDLLAHADGDVVPAAAVRALLAELERGDG